jgi:sugar/nucleoside kinase (ribokinase family)
LSSALDYLLIGHVADDITPPTAVPGGTVVYAGRAAQALGYQTAVVTSAGPGYDWQRALGDIPVANKAAARTTTFLNVETSHGRRQTIHGLAQRLSADDVPAEWRRPSIVHLAPIANEVDPAVANLFSDSLIGLTPQGWLRGWGDDGRVYPIAWPAAADLLPLAAAVILSQEDLPDPAVLDEFRRWARLVVVTAGAAGCTVYCRDESRHIAAPAVTAVNTIGAGDIFAAAFLIRLHQTAGNPWAAAEFANRIAARSVTQKDLDEKIDVVET